MNLNNPTLEPTNINETEPKFFSKFINWIMTQVILFPFSRGVYIEEEIEE